MSEPTLKELKRILEDAKSTRDTLDDLIDELHLQIEKRENSMTRNREVKNEWKKY